MSDKVVTTETTETHKEPVQPTPEKTVTETKVTEGAVSGEPGAPVVKTTEHTERKE